MNAPELASPEALAYLRLSLTPGLRPIFINQLVSRAGDIHKIGGLPESEWAAAMSIPPARAAALRSVVAGIQIDDILEDCQRLRLKIICPADPQWPPGLRPIPDPPAVLYLRGELLPDDTLAVAIVGARQCTLYGREQSEKFARGLAEAGMTVVSGGARGIDTAAHLGALRAGGRTLVISGCGLGHCYPPENHDLYDEVVSRQAGCIISEMQPDEPPLPHNFPPRNRIIAALSLGTLVVEANLRSGSMITARLAADDYGREVFAMPGRVDSPASSGTHHLIRSGGAKLVESSADIIESLGLLTLLPNGRDQAPPTVETQSLFDGKIDSAASKPQAPAAPRQRKSSAPLPAVAPSSSEPQPPSFSAPQEKILQAISAVSDAGVDELCQQTSLPAAVVMAELTMLELRGVIRRTPRQTFEKTT